MNRFERVTAFVIDEQDRTDHVHLTAEDRCTYLATYLSGNGYRSKPINQTILNLKCPPSVARRDRAQADRKREAIGVVAAMVRAAISRELIEHATWIPIPPSRASYDPDFDDRLTRILRCGFEGYDFDIRNILQLQVSTAADHSAVQRLRTEALYRFIHVNWHALGARPLRQRVMLFDDVLTTGKHYQCCKRRLRDALPAIAIDGLFIARRRLSARGRRVP
jgi:hypothetical protein